MLTKNKKCEILFQSVLFFKSFYENGQYLLVDVQRAYTTKSLSHSQENMQKYHRYTPEIPEPAPSLSRHGAQFGGLRVFPVIKITVVRQVRMLPACTAV